MHDKILLILDLDETLIHATNNPPRNGWDFEVFQYKVFKRPHLDTFLTEIQKYFYIAVWSSASDDYVAEIVKVIFPPDYPLQFIWGRSRCTYEVNYKLVEEFGSIDPFNHCNYVKKLKKLKKRKVFSLSKMLIVDDTPAKCRHNYGNAIYPIEYLGSEKDDELLSLTKYLISLKDSENVRNIEKRYWKQSIK